jgi:DtxR family Mn-dependent transcriptional regulator
MRQQAIEDYIKTIYVLAEADAPVSTSRLADARQVRPPSVSNMMKRLAALGLVNYKKSRGVTLTDEGQKIALETLRRHRLIELYLTEELGFGWDEVHEQAELLEHVISSRLEERIADILGHPEFDPHGDPIPSKGGEIVARRTERLSLARLSGDCVACDREHGQRSVVLFG